MNRTRQWQRNVLAAIVAASLAMPVAAAERSGPAAGARSGGLGLRQALESALGGWLGGLGRFTAVWGKDGHVIDPDGLRATNSPTAPPAATAATGTAPGDDGHAIDPNG
jgi:hypothetical protein